MLGQNIALERRVVGEGPPQPPLTHSSTNGFSGMAPVPASSLAFARLSCSCFSPTNKCGPGYKRIAPATKIGQSQSGEPGMFGPLSKLKRKSIFKGVLPKLAPS